MDKIAVKTAREAVHGVIVGVELHRRSTIGVVGANAVQHPFAVRLMTDRCKIVEEPSFSGVECGAILLDRLVVFCHNIITTFHMNYS